MKIAFISSYVQPNSGSKALLRLVDEIKKQGHEVQIITTSLGYDSEIIKSVKLPRGIDFLNRLFNSFFPNYFSLAHFGIIKKIEEFGPDVINIHWTHGFTIPVTVFPILSKKYPIFWTQHDLWAITINKFFEYDPVKTVIKRDMNFRQKIFFNLRINLPLLLKIKTQILSKLSINIISPSIWMKQKVSQSPVFSRSKQLVIPNGVKTDVFKPLDKLELRKKYNILPEKNAILFLTANLADKRKGAYFFIEAMKKLEETNEQLSNNTIVLTVGKGSDQLKRFIPQECVNLGSTSSDEELAEFYNLADVFISTSIGDNFPSTSLESISCGLPVIAFDVGGVGEIITDNINGFLIPKRHINDLSEKIQMLFLHEDKRLELSKSARKIATEKFDIKKQADAYLEAFMQSR